MGVHERAAPWERRIKGALLPLRATVLEQYALPSRSFSLPRRPFCLALHAGRNVE